MSRSIQLLRFPVGEQSFAIDLAAVECVLQAPGLDLLPGSPGVILGIFSLHGTIVPVADPRRRLGLADREIDLADWVAVIRTGSRYLGLLVGPGTGIATCDGDTVVPARIILGGIDPIEGVVQTPDGLLVIHDPAKFLTIAEELSLGEALDGRE